MRFNTLALNKAKDVFSRHASAVNAIFAEFRAENEVAKKFTSDYAEQRKAEARVTARGKLEEADRALHDEVQELARAMREGIYDVITELPRRSFRESLDVYNTFDVKLKESEIRAFASQALGYYTELRALQTLARKSGYNISVPDVDAVEADVARIERCARVPSMWIPTEYTSEAKEIGLKIPMFRTDGSVASWGNSVDAVYLATLEKAHSKLVNDMGNSMLERWNNLQPVTVEALSESEEDKANAATAEKNARMRYAEEMEVMNDETQAAAIEAGNAANAKAAENILARYTGKK